jgi:hypothetical protein
LVLRYLTTDWLQFGRSWGGVVFRRRYRSARPDIIPNQETARKSCCRLISMHIRDSPMSLEPVPLSIILPPLAQLPRALESLDEVCGVLEKALAPTKRFRRIANSIENDLRFAVAVHALNALDAARAVQTLGTTDHAGTLAPHFRTVFEALVKIRWMRKEPVRARNYLESEPFERYMLATPRVKASKRWPVIVQDCKATVARNPRLLKMPKVVKSKQEPFVAIAHALRMPDLGDMANAIGMDLEDYLIDFGVPSLHPHTSIVHTKNYITAINADGTFVLSAAVDPKMLLGYVARTASRAGEVMQEVLGVFPDGAIQFEAEQVRERLMTVATAINSLLRDRI